MLAKKLSRSERPTPPARACEFEPVVALSTHLLFVHSPRPTPRSLAWARRRGAFGFDASGLQSMLRLERLNLG